MTHPGETGHDQVQVFTARRIITMTTERPQAFAVRGEWIVATGTLEQLLAQFPGARTHNFGDATVTPGFNDAHQDLSPGRIATTAQLVAALRRRAARSPAGSWIIGFGYDPFRINRGTELTRAELDAACPDHPVLVVHVTLHTGVVNSRGLALAGLRAPADAPAGGKLDTGPGGQLNGVLHDQALYDLAFPAFTRRKTVVPPPSPDGLMQALASFQQRLHAAGITSAGDALVGPPGWELLRRAEAEGTLTVRVNALASYEHFGYFRPLAGTPVRPESRLRVGGIKAFADGAVNGGTCLVEDPVIGRNDHGLERVTPQELTEIVRDVHDAGWRICVHANGDRAIRHVLDAISAAQQNSPRADPRHRIEHTSLVNPQLIRRMRELGTVAVPFANYALAHGDKLRTFYGAGRAEWMFAHRAMLDAGVPVAGSSDYPCGPYEPLFAMRSCVTRLDRDGVPFGASQRITAAEALALYTTGSAYASGEERAKGKIAHGYLADFVVLGQDPLAVDGADLADIPVLGTWVGGRQVWAAA
jgi:predicted amidohydrolase YtcJ